MKNIKKVIFLFMAFLSLGMFFACSDSNDDGGETLVTKYTYNLTSNADYYIVNEFHCVDRGENIYDVRTANRHFFKNTSESYKDKTGQELINMVKAKSVTVTRESTATQSEAQSLPVKSSSGDVLYTLNIPAGMISTIYYYE
ncbi:MAG: hypothetical protein IJ630_05445 [Treponema sp.]|nr:hypothetical protein [Treponema sp.]